MIGSVLLVVSVVLGRHWATWTTAGVAAVFLALWYAVPLTARWRGRGVHPD